jgi:hypothetical protein
LASIFGTDSFELAEDVRQFKTQPTLKGLVVGEPLQGSGGFAGKPIFFLLRRSKMFIAVPTPVISLRQERNVK